MPSGYKARPEQVILFSVLPGMQIVRSTSHNGLTPLQYPQLSPSAISASPLSRRNGSACRVRQTGQCRDAEWSMRVLGHGDAKYPIGRLLESSAERSWRGFSPNADLILPVNCPRSPHPTRRLPS